MPPDAADRPPLAPEHYLILAGLAVVLVLLLRLGSSGDYGMSFYAFGAVVELLALAYALVGLAVIFVAWLVMRRALSGRAARTAVGLGVGIGLVVLFLYGFAPFRI